MRFIIGILGVCIGLLLIKYRAKVHDFTGLIGFAEKYLGRGGTYSFYLLLGLAIILLSILFATGQLQALMFNALSPYF